MNLDQLAKQSTSQMELRGVLLTIRMAQRHLAGLRAFNSGNTDLGDADTFLQEAANAMDRFQSCKTIDLLPTSTQPQIADRPNETTSL